jgi:hypothetical protein
MPCFHRRHLSFEECSIASWLFTAARRFAGPTSEDFILARLVRPITCLWNISHQPTSITMRFSGAALFLSFLSLVQAFLPRNGQYVPSICFPTKYRRSMIFSTLARAPTRPATDEEEHVYQSASEKVKRRRETLSGEEINSRLAIQMEKLRIKDASSPLLSKEVSCPVREVEV